ncbi:MAG: hypothetical protein Kow002_05160 [Anaerolineales bacterium]
MEHCVKRFQQYLAFLVPLLLGLSFYLPVRYETRYPRDIKPQFDPIVQKKYWRQIDERKPELLLLGDSMLELGVDADTLSRSLDKKTMKIGIPGSASALWYLILKNNILRADHQPETLVIFFRDTMMTASGYRVQGSYFAQIDEFADPSEDLLIELAYVNQMTKLERLAEGFFPLYGSRWEVRRELDTYIRYTLPESLLGCDELCMDINMETIFRFQKVDPQFLSDAITTADRYLFHRSALDFYGQVEQSFLPEIIRLCQENGIQLVLVRMNVLRPPASQTEARRLAKYMQDMQAYLAQYNIPLLDYADEEKLSATDLYDDPVHLNARGQATFTDLFRKDIQTIVE